MLQPGPPRSSPRLRLRLPSVGSSSAGNRRQLLRENTHQALLEVEDKPWRIAFMGGKLASTERKGGRDRLPRPGKQGGDTKGSPWERSFP